MSATSPFRAAPSAAGSPLSQTGQLPANRSKKGYHVIRPGRQPAAPVPRPGVFTRLWQTLRALLQVTPEQWHAQERSRRAGPGGSLYAGVMSGGQIVLMSPDTTASQRRPAQPDLP